jgi:acyl-coenzyme A synthetase/AMP-(fatty) acid ligase
VWIADPADPAQPVPDGAEGEIVIAGAQVALGYLGQAASSRGFAVLPDGRRAYRTGDLGRRGADGLLYCGGRLDRQVKLHGYRVELEEVESQLRRLGGIADAAVLAADRAGAPDHLVAFLVPDPAGTELPASDIALTRLVREALAERVPAYALPRVVRRRASLPLTANGKVDRAALRGLVA